MDFAPLDASIPTSTEYEPAISGGDDPKTVEGLRRERYPWQKYADRDTLDKDRLVPTTRAVEAKGSTA